MMRYHATIARPVRRERLLATTARLHAAPRQAPHVRSRYQHGREIKKPTIGRFMHSRRILRAAGRTRAPRTTRRRTTTLRHRRDIYHPRGRVISTPRPFRQLLRGFSLTQAATLESRLDYDDNAIYSISSARRPAPRRNEQKFHHGRRRQYFDIYPALSGRHLIFFDALRFLLATMLADDF